MKNTQVFCTDLKNSISYSLPTFTKNTLTRLHLELNTSTRLTERTCYVIYSQGCPLGIFSSVQIQKLR